MLENYDVLDNIKVWEGDACSLFNTARGLILHSAVSQYTGCYQISSDDLFYEVRVGGGSIVYSAAR